MFVTVRFEDVVGEILQKVDNSQMGVVLKRMMLRAATQVYLKRYVPSTLQRSRPIQKKGATGVTPDVQHMLDHRRQRQRQHCLRRPAQRGIEEAANTVAAMDNG